MRKKIKKGAKILAWSSAVLIVLLIVGYFLAAKYYLPRYFQENIIPELAEEAGIRGFSGKITNVGAFGADLGTMQLGDPKNPTLKADKVTLSYSLKKSWQRGHLVIDQITFRGVNLKCALRAGQLVINDIDREKFMTELQNYFVRKENGRMLSIQDIAIRKGMLELELNERTFMIPFELFIKSQNLTWNNITADLKLRFDERATTLQLKCDFEEGTVAAGINGKSSLQQLVELCKLSDAEMLPEGIYEGVNSFKGNFTLRLKPKLSLTGFKVNGTLENGRIDAGDISIRNILLPSGHRKNLDYSVIRTQGKFTVNVSNCRMQRPAEAEVRNFSCDFSLSERLPVKFSGRLKVPLETLSMWRVLDIKPLYGITFDCLLGGSYNRQSGAWQFSAAPWEKQKNNRPHEWFFKYMDSYIFATVKDLSVIGQGQRDKGTLDVKLDIPRANMSGRQRSASLRGFTLDEKLEINITDKFNVDLTKAAGELFAEHCSGIWSEYRWVGNAVKLSGTADISAGSKANDSKFLLDLQSFLLKKNNQHVLGDSIKITGGLNFSLTGNILAFNSLKTATVADLVKLRSRDLQVALKKMVLKQQLDFDKALNIGSSKNSVSADELKIDHRDITATVWQMALDAELGKTANTVVSNNLTAGMKFTKAVCETEAGSKSVASSGRIDLSFPVVDNKIIGKVNASADIPQCWYFSGTTKGRASAVKLDTVLEMDNGGTAFRLIGANGVIALNSAELSDSDYYLKFQKSSLKHEVSFKDSSDFPQPESVKLQLSSPDLKGGYKETIVELNKLDWSVFYNSHKVPQISTLLNAENFSAKSFITGSCKVPELSLRGQWNGVQATGRLKIVNAEGKLLKPAVAGRGIFAEIPLGWPKLSKQRSGAIRIDTVSADFFTVAKVELQIDPKPEALVFKGNFTNNISRRANNFCFGRIVLPPEKFHIDADFSIPEYRTVSPINLGRFIPEWDGVTLDGAIQGKANLKYDMTGLKYNTELILTDSEIKATDFSIKKLTTTLKVDNFNSETAREQQAQFGSLKYQRFLFTDGKVAYKINSADDIEIGRNSFNWLGGEAFVRPFTLKNRNSADNLDAYCRNMPVSEILSFLGIYQGQCNARLNGVIKAGIVKNALTVTDAKLNSLPDKPVTIKIAGLDKLIMPERGSEKDFACEILRSGFRYNWLKLGFAMNNRTTTVTVRADGQPISSPPFIYNYDTGKFTRCQPGKGNVAGEISLFINLGLFNDTL